jgi:hypothetical protein
MTRYMKVHWIHDFADEPTLIYSEIDQGIETRKVESFPDGHLDFASVDASSGSTILAEGLLPTVEDLASDPEFEPEAISREEFEVVWTRATGP